ncbi:MAG: TIGR02453 family protein [Flavobacteriales bacterium]|nr:TIGR02453 family protein [Flavobacteriales bacterium]
MPYFTPDFLDFFKELAANNNRDWFTENKKRYERSVKEPFNVFVQDVIDRAAKTDDRFAGLAKDAVFRIYKDVRFSKDKTPYKLQMGAVIAPGGKKDVTSPGMYLELGPEHFRFYSGVYLPDKDVLQRIREYILKNLTELDKLLSDKKFVENFGELRGEKNKILPKEFKAAAEKQPYLFNKQFYFFATLPPETILEENLADVVMNYFSASEPMRNYLSKAIGS